MIHRASDLLMKLTNHMLRRVITLDMLQSLPQRSGLPSTAALTPLGLVPSGSSEPQVV
jgi:hypothetical protein